MLIFKQKILFLLLILIFSGCTTKNNKINTKTIQETIPITMANIRGHKSLYNEGWFVISSSKDALKFAKKHGVDNAKDSLSKAIKSITVNMDEYSKKIPKNIEGGYKTTKSTFNKGTQNTKDILKTTKTIADIQLDYSKKSFLDAWSTFIKGNISLTDRTKEENTKLVNIGGDYFKNIKSDFSNLHEIASSITFTSSQEISKHWENAFIDAKKSFIESYDNSAESESSLGGLFHIMYGYLKAIYHGAIKPTANTAKSGVEDTYEIGKDITKLLYLPVGATASVLGRGVESLGLTLYYSSSIGVKIVSPTIEAGFLSALSIVSLSSGSLTYIGGGTLGLVNQIGTTAVSPIAGVTQASAKIAYDTTKLVTFVSYDVLKESTEIFINEAASGVVLGYNALLALPTHTLLAASDSIFFLAWDGPRLVVAMANGEISSENVNKLPVGTVVDLQKLKKQKNVKVKIVSEDYSVIVNILKQIPRDMKVK